MLCSPSLFTVLCGTFTKQGNLSPLRILEGHADVLRIIFEMACSQWWAAHIIPFPGSTIPVLLPLSRRDISLLEPPNENSARLYPPERQQVSGCPVAIVAQGVIFPPPEVVPMGTFLNQTSENLYVNMMPICIDSESDLQASLPTCCKQYTSMIHMCMNRLASRDKVKDSGLALAFLTVDERPVSCGESQRRGGIHVESPGMLPLNPHEMANGVYTPGAEHHWGRGMMMRNEIIDGGIFMASNIDNSCAIWNSHVNDPEGDVIGRLGDVRRLKTLLGPPTATLGAGDLVWMTDKTPHESLPLERSAHRQYFRLVTGRVTTWFASHSTPNPMWKSLKQNDLFSLAKVNVVEGNKFELYKNCELCKWKMGTPEELSAALKLKALRMLLNEEGLGHICDAIVASGIVSIDFFAKNQWNWDRSNFLRFNSRTLYYYEAAILDRLLKKLTAGIF